MMSISKAKQVAKDPAAYSTQDLDDALTAIVESDRITEAQVTALQGKIDPVLRTRLAQVCGKGTRHCVAEHPVGEETACESE